MSTNLVERFGIQYLHHMTSIENIPSILKFGIFANSIIRAARLTYTDVSNQDVQMNRNLAIPGTAKRVHDYVPFYFATHTPMQYVITHSTATRPLTISQRDLVFIDIAADQLLSKPGVLFTDGNAASTATHIYLDLDNLWDLDWNCLDGLGNYDSIGDLVYNSEWQRKRASEVLVPYMVESKLFSRLVVYDSQAVANLYIKTIAEGVQINVPVEYSSEITQLYYYHR